MPNSRSAFRPIAPKPRELSREFLQGPLQELSQESLRELPQGCPQGFSQEILQEPSRGRGHPQDFNSDIIAVATLTSPQPFIPEIQEITPIANTLTSLTTAKVSKKKNDRKTEKTGPAEDESSWDDESTGSLLSFLEENFNIYKKNKSNFAKLTAAKVFPGKSWEQIKNKLSRLVTKYNEIKEKKNQTGREAQAMWKWFERLDALLGTRENHNPGFLVDGFSDDIQLIDSFKEKEIKEESSTEIKDNQASKKRKSQDPLAEAIISMGNTRHMIWEKRLALESEQFCKRQELEREIREAEAAFKKQELEVERIKAETLQKKMEFDMEQSRMEYKLKMKELDLRMMKYKSKNDEI